MASVMEVAIEMGPVWNLGESSEVSHTQQEKIGTQEEGKECKKA